MEIRSLVRGRVARAGTRGVGVCHLRTGACAFVGRANVVAHGRNAAPRVAAMNAVAENEFQVFDEELAAQLERLQAAERENAKLKAQIDELERELEIDFEVRTDSVGAISSRAIPPHDAFLISEARAAQNFELSASLDPKSGAESDAASGPTLPEIQNSVQADAAPAAEEVVAVDAAMGASDLATSAPATQVPDELMEPEPEPEQQEEASPSLASEGVAPAAAVADEGAEGADYAKMTVKQLKVVLKERGLPVSGKKAVLIARLTEA